MLTLTITAGIVPFGTALPGNAQALANFMALYNGIGGVSNFNGINYGSTTPTADQRGYPWFQTDSQGNPVGLFSWNGLTWAAIPVQTASGASSARPGAPGVGTEFYDTSIGAVILWNGGNWTTLSGTIGDVKEVQAPNINTALTNNPGWAQDTASIGCVVAAAGPAGSISSAHSYGQLLGEETHLLQITELAAHTHTLPSGAGQATADGNVGNPSGILASSDSGATGSTGGNTPHNNIQPTIYYWRLVKTS